MIDLPQLYAACVVSYVKTLPNETFKGPAYLLGKDTYSGFDIPYHGPTFSAAFSILEELEILRRHSHEGMMRYYVIEAKDFFSTLGASTTYRHVRTYRIGRSIVDVDYKVLESYADLGDDWLRDAVETFREDIWSHIESLDDKEPSDVAPASDRVVTFEDNEAAIVDIDNGLQDIEHELKTSNEVGVALGDLRQIAVDEVSDLREALKRPFNRARALLSQARETLNWLIKRCAETSVSELAKHAIKLFISWLS